MRWCFAARSRGVKCDVRPAARTADVVKASSRLGRAGSAHGVQQTVRCCRIEFGRGLTLVAVLLLAESGVCLAVPQAAISGIVRDTQGVAQMGAMVQVIAGPTSVATAFTDMYGHYRIANLGPGKYEVRATAALFVPAMRANLRLLNGARATVNLTLNMLSDPTSWIPAERRRGDEPADDWNWTMRASASRPILRMRSNGQMVLVSSSATDHPGAPPLEARASVRSGDGGFGGGGSHNTLSFDRTMEDGSEMVLRSDFGTARTPYGLGPSIEIGAGYERRVILGGASRLVVSLESHPEMVNADGTLGLQMARISSAQKIKLGDAVDLEAGGTVYAIRTTGAAVTSQPFFRIALHPGAVWTVGYRMATSHDVQGFDGLNTLEAGIPMAAMVNRRMQTEGGNHQELSVQRKLGKGVVRAAVYRDAISRPVIAGTGVMSQADLQTNAAGSGVVADTVTDAFQFFGKPYTTRGVSVMMSEPLTSGLWAAVEYQSGAALMTRDLVPASLPEEAAGMHAVAADSLTAAVKGRIIRSGTKMRVSYRWEPRRLVTPVASYEAFSDRPYLSFRLRQTVRFDGLLPPGLEATVDVTNLLAQGYQPFLSADGRTLYLAQAPRSLQAGLSFTF
jgi:hypothetical protein